MTRVFEPVFTVWLSLVGLAIGSFLNVVIARVPNEQSIVRPRSRCPHCGHQLRWAENIPLFSWIALRGRCSACRARISARYPLVEVLTAALFLAALHQFDWTWPLVQALLLVTLLIPLTFIDLEHWLLPFALTLPGIVLGVLTSAPQGFDRVRDSLIGVAAGFLGFWGMEWIGAKAFKKEALGGGDKYLLALIGGFETFRALLGVVFLASLQGAIVGSVLLLIRGRAGPAPRAPPAVDPGDGWVPGPTNIPFGPWLALAALELLFLGGRLARWLPIPFGSLLFGG